MVIPALTMQSTYYATTLRSRTERAWAKQFDRDQLRWKYELCTFGKTKRYTPDFYLVQYDTFIEIKTYGSTRLNQFDLCTWPLFLIFGTPDHCYIRYKPRGARWFNRGHYTKWNAALAFIQGN